ncbi:hypothetical protein AB6A40_005685 [Gnathostoma spinigerum]|uniref:Sialin n=1 Tax=Gnathostoma spinigerum TaxID=75299 RepID=A0ABD6EIA5_9BILA
MYRLVPVVDESDGISGGQVLRNNVIPELDGLNQKWSLRRRHLVAILAFFGFGCIYAMRANISVAIVQMTTPGMVQLEGKILNEKAEFDSWDSVTQGVILGSFFYGYIFTQIPGGYLAHRFGGKDVYVIGIFGTAIFTLLTPPLAEMGKFALIAGRFIMGLLEGVTYPAMHVIWSHWAPALEKTQLASFAFSGSYLGTVFAMPLSAMLGETFGWPSIFYFFGLFSMAWCVIWVKNISELPENDSKITTEELTLLQRETTNTNTYSVPWILIFRSKAVWAIIAAHFCENWGFYIMLTNLPRILNDLMDYRLEKAGFVAALPYFIMGVLLIVSGSFSDMLIDRYAWSVDRTRKVIGSFGFLSQALLILLASANFSADLSLISLIASIGLGGVAWSAFSVNHLDIAPQYAGHLMGLSNTIATIPGMVAPIIVGAIVTDHLVSQWRVVFYMTAAVYLLGAAVYWRFASGKLESWASDQTPFMRTVD